MCAYSFPPTKDFEEWLIQYIGAHTKNAKGTTTALYAAYTLRLLNRTIRYIFIFLFFIRFFRGFPSKSIAIILL